MNRLSILILVLLWVITVKIDAQDSKSQPSNTLSFCPYPQLLYKNTKKSWIDNTDVAIKKWHEDFISIIKAELNRSKDGIYISISGKPVKLKNE